MKQAVLFYVFACLISWTIAAPLVLPHFGWKIYDAPGFQHAFVGLGPLMAAFIVKALMEGRAGLQTLFRAMVRSGRRWTLLVALFSPFVLLLLAAGFYAWRDGGALDFSAFGKTKEFPQFTLLTYFLYNLLFFGWGEETGWKGVLLPALQRRWTALWSTLLFAVLWAIWHWPLFFYRPGYVGMDVGGIAGWFFSLLTGAVLLTWLFNSSRGSILVCAVFHATIDVAFVSDFANKTIVGYIGFLITLWGIATVVVFGPRHLSKQPRITTLHEHNQASG